jgi:hypothetical protein
MEKDLLAEVIAAEREIEQGLEQEQAKAKEWLEAMKRDVAAGAAEEERQLRESCAEQQTVTDQGATGKAADIMKKAELEEQRLRSLRDETLREIAERHLARILPG